MSRAYCEHCKKEKQVKWTYFNPDEDSVPTLAVCSTCEEAIFLTEEQLFEEGREKV